MKTALPWLLAVIGIAAAAYFFNANKSTTAQVTTLQQEVRELQPLRAEIATLKSSLVPAEELARLRKDGEDVLRLRNQVRQLTEAKSTLTQQAQTAQTAAQQAQQQAAQAQAEAEAAKHHAAATPALTPEQAAAFARRYGTASTNSPAVDMMNTCINNLRQIDGAKHQWALENRQLSTATPDWGFLFPYLKGVMPQCPGDGKYTINAVNADPTCTIAGHALQPKQ